MFDNLKKMAELKKIQDSFKKEFITVEKNGVKVVMNGNFEVQEINLNENLGKEEQEKVLVQCLNEAKDNIQKALAKNLMSSGFSF
jgi:DNA-binding protein YbaB